MQNLTELPERISAFNMGNPPFLDHREIREETSRSCHIGSEASGIIGGITDGQETDL
jgi:hypothetical protein